VGGNGGKRMSAARPVTERKQRSCVGCKKKRLVDADRMCAECAGTPREDNESPGVLTKGHWVKRPGDAILVWEAS